MKKLTILLIIILLGIFLLNAMPKTSAAVEMTIPAMMKALTTSWATLSTEERNQVYSKMTAKETDDAQAFLDQYLAFTKLMTLSINTSLK